MNTDVIKNWADNTDAPMAKYNMLVKMNMDVLTALHLNAIRTYSEIGLTKIKAASENSDRHELQRFSTAQLLVLSELAQKMLDDSDKLRQVAVTFCEDIHQLRSTQAKHTAAKNMFEQSPKIDNAMK